MAKSLSPALKEVKILAGVAEAIMTPVSNQMKVKIYMALIRTGAWHPLLNLSGCLGTHGTRSNDDPE